MKTTSFFLLLCVIWLTTCCKKPEPRPRYELDQQTKDYTVFLEGSLWVYQLQNNAVKDTNKVSKATFGYGGSTSFEQIYEGVTSEIYSTYHKNKMESESEAYEKSNTEGLCNYNLWFEGARTSKKCLFFSNRSVNEKYNYWFYPDNVVTYQSFLPTYTLEGKTYNEVMVFESRYTGASVAFDDVRLPVKVYFAKHIGIIRKEMKNGDVWNLIHHEVKQ